MARPGVLSTWATLRKGRRATIGCVLVAVGVVAMGIGRQLAEGSNALADCDRARGRADYVEAVAAAKRAAEALVPGSPYAARGFERLADIAQDAERRGDEVTAAAAWRGMRGAALATSAIGVSTGKWRAVSEDGLVRVAAQMARVTASGAPNVPAPAETTLRAALSTDDTPSTWRFVALAGFAVLLLAAASRVFRALTRIQIGTPDPRKLEKNAK